MDRRDGFRDMKPCRYMTAEGCVNRIALPIYGPRPSEGVCAQCRHRDGWRGLGDAIAWLISFTPARALQESGCGGCKKRQEALNAAVPMKPCGCGNPAAKADEPKEN